MRQTRPRPSTAIRRKHLALDARLDGDLLRRQHQRSGGRPAGQVGARLRQFVLQRRHPLGRFLLLALEFGALQPNGRQFAFQRVGEFIQLIGPAPGPLQIRQQAGRDANQHLAGVGSDGRLHRAVEPSHQVIPPRRQTDRRLRSQPAPAGSEPAHGIGQRFEFPRGHCRRFAHSEPPCYPPLTDCGRACELSLAFPQTYPCRRQAYPS